MKGSSSVRQYGKQAKKCQAERLFAELPQSPVRKPAQKTHTSPTAGKRGAGAAPRKRALGKAGDDVDHLSELISGVTIQDEDFAVEQRTRGEEDDDVDDLTKADITLPPPSPAKRCMEDPAKRRNSISFSVLLPSKVVSHDSYIGIEDDEDDLADLNNLESLVGDEDEGLATTPDTSETSASTTCTESSSLSAASKDPLSDLRVLAWADLCPPSSPTTITKIAEASYAEVYRITNQLGTSIIKTIRLSPSPIKLQTAPQAKSGLVDEEPHSPSDLLGELQISEWLADIPGFVVYKDKYIVEGKCTKKLLETHQGFHKKLKRGDPDRLQFYPSPSRYLEGTRFLVVELGDAGTALEDWEISDGRMIWDVFFLVAIAFARAEDMILFEHRDLHEGNLCIKQLEPPKSKDPSRPHHRFGYSGLDITILDYGLSRAEEDYSDISDSFSTSASPIVAYDLEKDLSIFSSIHAAQCQVYRQMRTHLLQNTFRKTLPPSAHTTPYQKTFTGDPLTWEVYAPYTNVLWLAYIYDYLVSNFVGDSKELAEFKKETKELWTHLNPKGRSEKMACFGTAGDTVRYAIESGWILEDQIVGSSGGGNTSTFLTEREESIILSLDEGSDECGGIRNSLRRSPRRNTAV